jgi:hypothetical protein
MVGFVVQRDLDESCGPAEKRPGQGLLCGPVRSGWGSRASFCGVALSIRWSGLPGPGLWPVEARHHLD